MLKNVKILNFLDFVFIISLFFDRLSWLSAYFSCSCYFLPLHLSLEENGNTISPATITSTS